MLKSIISSWVNPRPSALIASGAALALSIASTNGAASTTTNAGALGHFWSAIESSNRPVTVLSFGDSMADSYSSATYHLMNKVTSRFGVAGYSLNNYYGTAILNYSNGATNRGPDYFWFTGYTQVPTGGAVWWENQMTSGGIYCDRAGIYYISQTNGGQFRFAVSANGGPWVTKLLLEGYSATPTGRFTNVWLPPNRYRIRVDSELGTNFIIGPSLVASSAFGIHAAFMDWPGINLSQVTNVPLSIRQPIFAALQPDLLVWHMKEEQIILPFHSNNMAACETWWSNAAPNCDIIYIGTTWLSADTNSTWTSDQNAITRSIAQRYHRTYADLMTPTMSYPWLLTNGFMKDTVHLNSAGGLYCANVMWDDLGFFALGLNRRLTLQPNGSQLQLSYQTTTSARYRLETSTNLLHWSVLHTNPFTTTTFTTNFIPPAGPNYYRLGLTPP